MAEAGVEEAQSSEIRRSPPSQAQGRNTLSPLVGDTSLLGLGHLQTLVAYT